MPNTKTNRDGLLVTENVRIFLMKTDGNGPGAAGKESVMNLLGMRSLGKIKEKGEKIMYKVSEVNLDDVVKTLLESELGFLLIQSDNNCKNMYDVLSEKSTYEDRLGMFGYNTHITYHLFPLMYHKSNETESSIAKARANALHNIFARWTDKGYNKYHAKDPFACKAFIKYIEELEWTNADYMLLLVE